MEHKDANSDYKVNLGWLGGGEQPSLGCPSRLLHYSNNAREPISKEGIAS